MLWLLCHTVFLISNFLHAFVFFSLCIPSTPPFSVSLLPSRYLFSSFGPNTVINSLRPCFSFVHPRTLPILSAPHPIFSFFIFYSSTSCSSDPQSCVRAEGDKSDLCLQFHLPLSFRPKPPLIALQAVKDRYPL